MQTPGSYQRRHIRRIAAQSLQSRNEVGKAMQDFCSVNAAVSRQTAVCNQNLQSLIPRPDPSPTTPAVQPQPCRPSTNPSTSPAAPALTQAPALQAQACISSHSSPSPSSPRPSSSLVCNIHISPVASVHKTFIHFLRYQTPHHNVRSTASWLCLPK